MEYFDGFCLLFDQSIAFKPSFGSVVDLTCSCLTRRCVLVVFSVPTSSQSKKTTPLQETSEYKGDNFSVSFHVL